MIDADRSFLLYDEDEFYLTSWKHENIVCAQSIYYFSAFPIAKKKANGIDWIGAKRQTTNFIDWIFVNK